MALHFLQGTTTYGAADHQVDFFATLEDFLVNTVGWTVVAGAGTTNIRFRSIGENGLMTMLFLHIWVVGNTIRGEVSDDAIPTHETAEGGNLVIFTDVQARYWLTADLDTAIMVVPYSDTDRVLYLGLLDPVGTPADETYRMVASDPGLAFCSILRWHTGVWDVDIQNFMRTEFDNIHVDRLTIEAAPYAIYAERQQNCAGQYRHIGKCGNQVGLEPHDIVSSTVAGATSEWTVFANATTYFLVLTAGAPPGDVADGAAFAYATGAGGTAGAVMTAVQAHLTAVGWTFQGSPGVWTTDWLFSSPGEDGLSDLWLHFGHGGVGNQFWYISVWDDGIPTHATSPSWSQCNNAWFPIDYHIAADLDCMCFGYRPAGSLISQFPLWGGKCVPFYPSITDSDYLAGSMDRFTNQVYLLRNHEAGWSVAGGLAWWGNTHFTPSSPNSFDGTTYTLHPYVLGSLIGGAGNPHNPGGVMKYIMHVDDGGGLAYADTITVGAQQYFVFGPAAGAWAWAMRMV